MVKNDGVHYFTLACNLSKEISRLSYMRQLLSAFAEIESELCLSDDLSSGVSQTTEL